MVGWETNPDPSPYLTLSTEIESGQSKQLKSELGSTPVHCSIHMALEILDSSLLLNGIYVKIKE